MFKRIKINKKTLKRFLKTFFGWFVFVVIVIILAVAMRVFLLASFVIPSYSMAPTILPGDFVLVNKMIPGGRIPVSWDFFKGKDWRLKRVKGWRAVKRNEILVFNYPYTNWHKLELDFNVFYAKRCIAVAGDTFYIENGIYHVQNCPDTLGCYANQLKVSQIENREKARPHTWDCFPHDTVHYRWNIKNFGPLYVPAVNDTLAVDSVNIKLYRNLIEYETNLAVSVQNGKVMIGSDTVSRYVFQKNYYFMAGDYAEDSRDSRYWGLLPEDHIVGKAFIIWKSKNRETGKWQWKRFFKKL